MLVVKAFRASSLGGHCIKGRFKGEPLQMCFNAGERQHEMSLLVFRGCRRFTNFFVANFWPKPCAHKNVAAADAFGAACVVY